MTSRSLAGAVAVAAIFVSTHAFGADPALKCRTSKLKLAGAYASCRLKADASAASKGVSVDYSKCDATLNTKFPAAETKAGPGICPSEGDVGDTQDFVVSCDDVIANHLATDAPLPTGICGNGVLEPGESCDGAALGGRTCSSFGAADFTGLTCKSDCTFDFTGCSYSTVPGRYRDNGDGTATDLWTGRMWEQKTGTPGSFVDCNTAGSCTDPHDVNNDYHWTASSTALDGPIVTNFLDRLNDVAGGGASCFAGHCDWRLPSVLELKGIVLEPEAVGTCSSSPCIDPTFPGQTGVGGYWTGTTVTGTTTSAFYVRFDAGGGIFPTLKIGSRYVRAVRTDF